MELFQPLIGLRESPVFLFVELFQPQEEMPGLVILTFMIRLSGAEPAANRMLFGCVSDGMELIQPSIEVISRVEAACDSDVCCTAANAKQNSFGAASRRTSRDSSRSLRLKTRSVKFGLAGSAPLRPMLDIPCDGRGPAHIFACSRRGCEGVGHAMRD